MPGLRDRALLESAVAAPQATYGGKALIKDVVDIAAAYLFYLCRNHPFNDGNKRTALVAALRFLRKNGWNVVVTDKLMYLIAINVARGEVDRDDLAEIFRTHMKPTDVEDD